MSFDKIITPRRREDFFDKSGDPTLRFVRWIESVTGQTNTSSENIEANSVTGNYSWDASGRRGDITNTVTTSVSYTMMSGEFVNAKSDSTVTFPEFPEDSSIIIIRNGDGSTIGLDGNGKKMNGELTGTIKNKGTAIEFYYFIDTDEWFAR